MVRSPGVTSSLLQPRSRTEKRQVDPHRGALAELAVDLHLPAGLFDEAIDLRQAEPGPLPHLFGGEERLERLLDDVLRHADAGIRHGDHPVAPWRRLVVAG